VEIWDLQRSLQQNVVSSLKLYLMMGPAIYEMIQTASGCTTTTSGLATK
jgi:hypothetical protein